MKDRVCTHCGKTFTPRTRGQVTDSRACAIARQVAGRTGKRHITSRTLCREAGCRRHGHDHRCSLKDCDYRRYHRETGYCRGHFTAWREAGSPDARRSYVRSEGRCSIPWCRNKHRRNGLCDNHSKQRDRLIEETVFYDLDRRRIFPAAPLQEHIQGLLTRGRTWDELAEGLSVSGGRADLARLLARDTIREIDADRYCTALGLHMEMLWPSEVAA